MTTIPRKPRRVPFHTHPVVTAVMPSLLGLVVGVLSAAALAHIALAVEEGIAAMETNPPLWLLRVVARPWQALLLGTAIGIPAGLAEVYALRTRFPLFVRRSTEGIVPSTVDPVAALAWIPTVVAPLFAFWLGWTLSYAPPVAFFGALIPIVMTYPQERRIHQAIKRAAEPVQANEDNA